MAFKQVTTDFRDLKEGPVEGFVVRFSTAKVSNGNEVPKVVLTSDSVDEYSVLINDHTYQQLEKANVGPGDYIRIEYQGTVDLGDGRRANRFRVLMDPDKKLKR